LGERQFSSFFALSGGSVPAVLLCCCSSATSRASLPYVHTPFNHGTSLHQRPLDLVQENDDHLNRNSRMATSQLKFQDGNQFEVIAKCADFVPSDTNAGFH